MREGFFSRQSNPTTIATSVRFKIASCLAMTTLRLEPVNGNVVVRQSFFSEKVFDCAQTDKNGNQSNIGGL
jgi:hypothetical protein